MFESIERSKNGRKLNGHLGELKNIPITVDNGFRMQQAYKGYYQKQTTELRTIFWHVSYTKLQHNWYVILVTFRRRVMYT